PGTAVGRALREILTLTRGNAAAPEPPTTPSSASEWLARSYALQARFRLAEARDAAARAVLLAPRLGFAHARLAELEFSLEHRRQALTALDAALRQAPRLASAHALKGFVLLEDHRPREALVAFDRAIALDAALGHAWLGRGLALQRLRQQSEALLAFQTAAALEPRRALLRSYLGKAFSAAGEPALAEKDLHQARNLDPGDPTAWFYSALHHWQQNRPNRAVGELERSIELNDHRQIFRSRLGLDRDRAVRSANLAAVYEDAGLSEAGRRAAAHAVSEDYANFSAHLFLSDSYRAVEDPNRFDLRHESARFSELLVANLLAPSGSGNLSQLLPQQERLRFFDPAPLGFSSLTTFQSPGNWQQLGTAFGSLQGFSYALDVAYAWQREQEINDWRERKDASLQIKQRLGPQDELYLQVAFSDGDSGDVARHYDPTNAHPDLRVSERQVPNLLAGWHRAWTPASHTLLLLARLSDDFHLSDEGVNVLHLQPDVANAVRVSYPAGGYGLRFAGDFTLYSAELQHIWQHDRHTVVAGGRLQSGAVESEATLSRVLTGAISEDQIDEPMRRANGYLYYHVQVFEPLRLVGGASYDRLTFPRNSELAPLTSGEETIDLPTPKTGLLFTPWRGGSLRGAYTRSLGGLFFDNSVRIEPAHVAGFSQAFRSVLPESSVGLVAGSTFDTGNIAFDQRLPGGTHLGVAAEWLHSEGERTLGVTTGPAPVPFPGAVASTEQTLKFRERNFSAYAVQLLGDGLSLGARYRLSEAQLETRLPEVPKTATGLDQAEQSERSLLHQVALSLHYQHSGGAFGQWETVWHRQHNSGYTPARPGDDFWQHHFWVGYRFPRRTLEVRAGVLNLTDQDYRLNPLNSFVAPPRHRTAVVSLRLNF
ncbi:MAG TPA: hypothetical protein VNO52_01960, partial [Methylomirabilota bacterium]|nr:hypothetical protein [Methylomirabilota bacterium]